MRAPPFSPELFPYLILVDQLPQPWSWPAIFGREAPVEVEVGPGKGMFLANAATANPTHDFLAIEHAGKYVRRTADRLRKRKIPNARVLASDALRILAERIPDASVRTLHVYFPDPWWKKRHKKRRVFTPEFIRDVARVLEPGGVFRLATDVEDYFHLMLELVADEPRFRRLDGAETPAPGGEEYLTNFERKFRIEGRPIYKACYEKLV